MSGHSYATLFLLQKSLYRRRPRERRQEAETCTHRRAGHTQAPPPWWVPTPTQLPWEEAPRAGAPSRARWLGALRGVVQVPVAFSLLQKLLCSVGSHHGKHLNQRANVASNPGHSLGFLHSISLQD